MANLRTRIWSPRGAALTLALVGALGAFIFSAQNITAQSGDPALRIVAPTESVADGDDNIPFEIHADNVDNLASFQFVLQYRDDVFEFASAQQGPFLGSSDREVVCNEPISDAGSVRFTCITLRPEPAGATGSGHLATIFLNATGAGSTEVTLDRVKLLHVDETASEIENVALQSATIDVASSSSTNWLMWGGIAAAAIVVLGGAGTIAAMRMRTSSTPAAPKLESPQ